MTRSRGINRPRAAWTAEQLADLLHFYPRFKTEDVAFMLGQPLDVVYRKAHTLGLKKTPEFLASVAAGRLDGVRGGATRFRKGQAAWNAGMKGLHLGGERTQFKPGQMPHNTVAIGSYRVSKDGTLQQKTSNDKGSNSKRWRGVHELVWIRENGPVPPKHIIVFKPGMRTTVLAEITIDRVECISLAENMKRNTRHNLPPELNEVVHLRAVLTRQINKRRKNDGQESQHPRSA